MALTPSPADTPGPGSGQENSGGLNRREKTWIVVILAAGVTAAALLILGAPYWLVDAQNYRCPPNTAGIAPSQLSASCQSANFAGAVDAQALDAAHAAQRATFGVVSAGLLAGAAAAVGVIVSNHNARLTKEANELTQRRDYETAENTRKTFVQQSERNREASEQARLASDYQRERDRDTTARERERAAEDRFTTAIDQLGHPSASVRLGAMHSLHRLAQSDPGRLPTVVDVLCAYLRQPFHHPHHDWRPSPDEPDTQPPARAWWPATQKERDERDGERQVRATSTRLIPTLLPLTAPPQPGEAPPLEINLDGAMLDGLDLSGRRTGHLRLDGAHISGSLWLGDGARIDGRLRLGEGACITGGLWLGEDTHITGDLYIGESAYVERVEFCDGAHIDGRVWLSGGAHINGRVQLGVGAHIGGLWLSDSAHISDDLWLEKHAYIIGSVWLGDRAHIDGSLELDKGAHITGTLRLGPAAYITGNVTLGKDAHIGGNLVLAAAAHLDGALSLDERAHITGGLQLIKDAFIAGSLVLSEGAHIDGPVVIGEGAHIDGHLVGAKGKLSEVRRHPEAAMRSSWFISAGVDVVELGDWITSPPR